MSVETEPITCGRCREDLDPAAEWQQWSKCQFCVQCLCSDCIAKLASYYHREQFGSFPDSFGRLYTEMVRFSEKPVSIALLCPTRLHEFSDGSRRKLFCSAKMTYTAITDNDSINALFRLMLYVILQLFLAVCILASPRLNIQVGVSYFHVDVCYVLLCALAWVGMNIAFLMTALDHTGKNFSIPFGVDSDSSRLLGMSRLSTHAAFLFYLGVDVPKSLLFGMGFDVLVVMLFYWTVSLFGFFIVSTWLAYKYRLKYPSLRVIHAKSLFPLLFNPLWYNSMGPFWCRMLTALFRLGDIYMSVRLFLYTLRRFYYDAKIEHTITYTFISPQTI